MKKGAEQGDGLTRSLFMVISDIEMPEMDGYTLAREIRRDERLRSLYVLLHSSISGQFNHEAVERAGADRFIPKFNPDDLAKAVIEHYQAQS